MQLKIQYLINYRARVKWKETECEVWGGEQEEGKREIDG